VNTDEICERESERTRIQNAVVGEDFEYVRHCAGTISTSNNSPVAQSTS